MTLSNCELFGFDNGSIQACLTALELEATDRELSEILHSEVIAPNVDRIVGEFYSKLLQITPASKYITDDATLQRLRVMQAAYVLSLGGNFDTLEYFENRLRVGMVHARVGVPLSLYLQASRLLEQAIYNVISDSRRTDPVLRDVLYRFIRKIMTLDMSLAAQTYHTVNMNRLHDSINFLRREDDYLRLLANTDSLTGLCNHECGMERLAAAWEDTSNSGASLCLIMADLDHFKQINDNYGHQVGDVVLRDVAGRLKATVRRQDSVSRYGGEEFMVLFVATEPEIARDIALRIVQRVASTPINIREQRISITISLGLYHAQPGDTVDTIINRADQALYQAKARGRNQVAFYASAMESAHRW